MIPRSIVPFEYINPTLDLVSWVGSLCPYLFALHSPFHDVPIPSTRLFLILTSCGTSQAQSSANTPTIHRNVEDQRNRIHPVGPSHFESLPAPWTSRVEGHAASLHPITSLGNFHRNAQIPLHLEWNIAYSNLTLALALWHTQFSSLMSDYAAWPSYTRNITLQ